jgi:hypothetical protein
VRRAADSRGSGWRRARGISIAHLRWPLAKRVVIASAWRATLRQTWAWRRGDARHLSARRRVRRWRGVTWQQRSAAAWRHQSGGIITRGGELLLQAASSVAARRAVFVGVSA